MVDDNETIWAASVRTRRHALERSRLFDQQAERYDRCRPRYPDAVIDALLGTPYVQFTKGPDGKKIVKELRRPDGIWYGPPYGEPQNRRLSGVLALMSIDPWNFASKTGLLIPNPWAEMPLPHLGLGTAELTVVGDGYERKEGKPMHELVGLSAAWPEG